MSANESSQPARRKSPASDPEIAAAILKALYKRKQEGDESSVSRHTLCSLPDIPTQRDQRVGEILLGLCERGYVTQIKIEERVGYRISENGVRFWINHAPALAVILGLRRAVSYRK